MKTPILRIQDLKVLVENKPILKGLDLSVNSGEVIAIMGPNGGGKSSLALSLMGDHRYEIAGQGRVEFLGRNLLDMEANERVKEGLFVSWQNPITIPGVTLFNLCKASYEAVYTPEVREEVYPSLVEFKKTLEKLAEKVGLPKSVVGRNVNEGFSGGERKRLELMQLIMLKPKLAILDEIDSGLDVDGLKMVAKIITELQKAGTAIILITHYKRLLDYIAVNKICLMRDGRIERVGGLEVAIEIEELGYGELSARV